MTNLLKTTELGIFLGDLIEKWGRSDGQVAFLVFGARNESRAVHFFDEGSKCQRQGLAGMTSMGSTGADNSGLSRSRLPTPESMVSGYDELRVEQELVHDWAAEAWQLFKCITLPSRHSRASSWVSQCAWLSTCITELKKHVLPKLTRPLTRGSVCNTLLTSCGFIGSFTNLAS